MWNLPSHTSDKMGNSHFPCGNTQEISVCQALLFFLSNRVASPECRLTEHKTCQLLIKCLSNRFQMPSPLIYCMYQRPWDTEMKQVCTTVTVSSIVGNQNLGTSSHLITGQRSKFSLQTGRGLSNKQAKYIKCRVSNFPTYHNFGCRS